MVKWARLSRFYSHYHGSAYAHAPMTMRERSHYDATIITADKFVAHLWEAYAIPLALSVIHRPSSVMCCQCRPYLPDIRFVFGANVYHVPGLCLLGIGCAP